MPTSSLRKSVSVSRRRKIKLRWVLKRDVRFVPAQKEHLAWLWAAYRRGAFTPENHDAVLIKPGLDTAEFEDEVMRRLSMVDEAFMLYAPGHRKDQPVGICWMIYDTHGNAEVHVEWFPWVTARNKIETAATFLREMGKQINLIVYSEMKNRPFFERMMDCGVLTRVGHINGFFKSGEKAAMYQSRLNGQG